MKIFKNIIKTLFGVVCACGLALLLLLALAYLYVELYPVCEDFDAVAPVETGLLLGTSKYVSKGVPNAYYDARISAAAELYRRGKIRRIIASGDYSTRYYNEPKFMREDLIAKGVRPADIAMDYAGLSTYDSVVRCKDIFDDSAPVIISQKFHCKRALFIADNLGMRGATAFAAGNGKGASLSGWRSFAREILARVKAFIDVSGS